MRYPQTYGYCLDHYSPDIQNLAGIPVCIPNGTHIPEEGSTTELAYLSLINGVGVMNSRLEPPWRYRLQHHPIYTGLSRRLSRTFVIIVRIIITGLMREVTAFGPIVLDWKPRTVLEPPDRSSRRTASLCRLNHHHNPSGTPQNNPFVIVIDRHISRRVNVTL